MEKNNTTTNEPNKENDVPVDSVQSGFINFSISKKKLTAVAILIIIIVAIILGLSIHYRNKLSALEEQLDIPEEQDIIEVTNEVQITTSTLREIIAPAKELVSYKYYYTDAGVFEKNKKLFDTDINIPFTKNQQVYVYSGTIGVGLNIDEINFDVDETSKKITISMPELTILYHEMDTKNFQSYDVKSSIFSALTLRAFCIRINIFRYDYWQNITITSWLAIILFSDCTTHRAQVMFFITFFFYLYNFFVFDFFVAFKIKLFKFIFGSRFYMEESSLFIILSCKN